MTYKVIINKHNTPIAYKALRNLIKHCRSKLPPMSDNDLKEAIFLEFKIKFSEFDPTSKDYLVHFENEKHYIFTVLKWC